MNKQTIEDITRALYARKEEIRELRAAIEVGIANSAFLEILKINGKIIKWPKGFFQWILVAEKEGWELGVDAKP